MIVRCSSPRLAFFIIFFFWHHLIWQLLHHAQTTFLWTPVNMVERGNVSFTHKSHKQHTCCHAAKHVVCHVSWPRIDNSMIGYSGMMTISKNNIVSSDSSMRCISPDLVICCPGSVFPFMWELLTKKCAAGYRVEYQTSHSWKNSNFL